MLKKIFKEPQYYFILFLGRIFPNSIFWDKIYLKMLYRNRMGKKLNLKNPKTYNEKLNWLKIYNRNPEYSKMVDKYEVKEYVKKKVGEKYVIPTYEVYENLEEIDFDKLPNRFVLKCTHDSGGVVICKDKNKINIDEIKQKINHSYKRKYYLNTREWPYKNVKPRIIVEKYMVDESGYELKDYKFFVFNGKVRAMFIATDRTSTLETCFDFFDRDFNHLDIRNGHPNSTNVLNKPKKLDKMIEIAEKLGENIPHARIDLYNINGEIYFGEITFFHWSGLKPFEPEEWDYKFGEWLMLPQKGYLDKDG